MRNRFSELIVKNRWISFAVFVILAVISAVMVFQTNVIYDLSEFAAKDSYTQKAVKIMKKEFDDKGSAYVMVKDISQDDTQTLLVQLSEIEGVATVAFNADTDYKNNSAIFTVSLKDYDSTDNANDTIKRIIDFLSDKEAYLSGQSAMSYYTRLETVENIINVGIIIVIAILIMLLLTSKTYFEIVIMILVFGVSVVINMGTNFIFNGISYISNLVALILQLALSLDYSIIMLHRFMEEKKTSDSKTAMKQALTKGIPEILSSSFTTIAGLCSLMFMTLPLGFEMGASLAKGIVVSLLTVIFFMPTLLVLCDKPLQKTKHKSFVPNVTKPAKLKLKARKIIVPVFFVVIALACVGQFFNKYSFNINGASRIVNAQKEIAEELGHKNDLVVVVPKGDYNKELELINYVKSKDIINSATALTTIQVTDELKLIDYVTKDDIIEMGSELGLNQTMANMLFSMYINENEPDTDIPVDEYRVMFVDLMEFAYKKLEDFGMDDSEYAKQLEQLTMARANFESKDYSRIMFNINSTIESAESLELIEELTKELKQFYDEFYLAGESVASYDMAEVFPRDNFYVSLLTALFVLIILLFTFKNLFIPILITLAIQGGIWINFVIPLIGGNPVSFIGYLLVSAMQMGATIDYAIVLTNRFQTTKTLFTDKLEAMAQAENAVFPTIITSGIILTVSGLTMGIVASGVVAQLGMLLGIGALTSILVVLLVVPSLLLVFDNLIEKSHFKNLIRKKSVQKK